MFAKPRPKKDALSAPPPKRRRKADYAIEEINFDDTARADYLTGFHKRKVQRQKQAQEVAAEKARQEKIEFRKHLREQRQQAVEDHVQQVNETLRAARLAGGEEDEKEDEDGEEDDEWGGIADEDKLPEFVDHEEEYVDEDRFTTVTVEAVNVDRDGMHRLGGHADENENSDNGHEAGEDSGDDATRNDNDKTEKDGEKEKRKDKKVWPKKKKTKFRYENKIERQMSRQKQKRKR